VALAPDSFDGFAAALAAAGAEGRSVRIAGAGTKAHWGSSTRREGQTALSTTGLDQIYEHSRAEATAVVGAGVKLARLQAELADAGQMLALDPPRGETATVGGIFATGDSGPLRHRFGTPRDQILAVTVALADGTVARSGPGGVRSLTGYDLARLFCASFGTLGVILSLTVRLAPRPERTVTALGLAEDPATLAAAAAALASSPVELLALDIAWHGGRGGLLAQVGGVEAERPAARAAAVMSAAGLIRVDVTDQDSALWARQRAGQRSPRRALVRVSARPSQLPLLLTLADLCGATVVGRAASGVSYVELDPARVPELRRGLVSGMYAELLDRPLGDPAPESSDPWGPQDESAVALMRAVKTRFDPARVCNPGLFVGGI
jgi:glycolate oxidase FAD binding subunit